MADRQWNICRRNLFGYSRVDRISFSRKDVTRFVRSLFSNQLFTFQSVIAPADQLKSAMIGGIY